MNSNNIFYCYSPRLRLFLKSLGFQYGTPGINKNTNTKYFPFEKSEALDFALNIWGDLNGKDKN